MGDGLVDVATAVGLTVALVGVGLADIPTAVEVTRAVGVGLTAVVVEIGWALAVTVARLPMPMLVPAVGVAGS